MKEGSLAAGTSHSSRSRPTKGRGASFNPPNRFDKLHLEPLELEPDDEERCPVPTAFYKDISRTILVKNDSPDIGFTYSINPYRGCEHGCIYCYARPSHEYLGFSAGIDFETKITVKLDAARLLEAEFRKRSWHPQTVCLSGNTDCYQPIERKLQLTRQCLEVFLNHRNPVSVITKNFLITRDLDILKELAALNLATVSISVTSLKADLIRRMEPRTSTPSGRFETIEVLAKNGIPVIVNIAPIIPGLNDEEIPLILKEAAARGASSAAYVLLRLPGAVGPLFLDWLQREIPGRAAKIVSRLKGVRQGRLNDSRWGKRMKGEGEYAKMIHELFKLYSEKYGLIKAEFNLSTKHFRRGFYQQTEIFG